ncbi:copper resistance protein CopC [Rothia nasimurium]|uniref:Copper resistance protein CopC n=1 Tax=Rothia nasimurium TaxID=85336 RepID=A0A4Y9F647_9MICC|nr:copper resistance CopC family protein [Rothia nasimurium]MBF0807295.1 copper resistance protein CopC [Rothia nasimurium]TFU24038.1 copper resistance protein CopC [Rothia nasimurium]
MFKARTASPITRTLVATAALAAGSLLGMNPAAAHDELVSTNPTDGAILTEAPASLELTYSGDIMDVDGANQVRVTNAAGESITDGDPEVDGTVVTQDLSTAAADDTYTVTWRVVSSDGHPIQGTFTYTVGQGSKATDATTQAATTGAAEPSSENTGTGTPAASDPVSQASEGLSTPLKVVLALVAVAALSSALVVLAKTKRK